MRRAEIRERETAWAARWATGAWRGETLETARGERYHIVYEGRRGGGAGPDFRDAILARPDGSRVLGDVELHLRASGWRAHGHERDPRYAHVVLHVVFHPLTPGNAPETLLSTGETAPIAVVGQRELADDRAPKSLPCVGLSQRSPRHALRALLRDAGQARIAERADRLMREIAVAAGEAGDGCRRWTPPDRVLWAHLAEALGYGRDRAALRWAGERLAESADPDALRRECAQYLSRLDSARLDALLRLHAQWAETGPWEPLRRALEEGSARAAAVALCRALHTSGAGISPGRARIVIANVALPFAIAYATLDGDAELGERALEVYGALPGLQSNAITRLMSRQLGMARLPEGAGAQQGLHHIWNTWCREKRCEVCPCNRA
ncbi:MAG TPA: DUF2851 family protein [Ktedonobacterales bacterium]|nr:DUF2851 family protein [Ktedonobacterales bacterium]